MTNMVYLVTGCYPQEPADFVLSWGESLGKTSHFLSTVC
jgi:hypothetical protein